MFGLEKELCFTVCLITVVNKSLHCVFFCVNKVSFLANIGQLAVTHRDLNQCNQVNKTGNRKSRYMLLHVDTKSSENWKYWK